MKVCDIFRQCIYSLVTLYCTHQYIMINTKKKMFPRTKSSTPNGRFLNRFGLLVHGEVVLEFCSSLIVYCEKTSTMAKVSITERAQEFSCAR